ncbi:MAG TPA: hypothetical protein ENO29_03030, partial [Candidatus Aminicenantes bacterium]
MKDFFRTPWLKSLSLSLLLLVGLYSGSLYSQSVVPADQQKLPAVFHSISSNQLFDYVKELSSEKYGGR